jgi:hypothetical protein
MMSPAYFSRRAPLRRLGLLFAFALLAAVFPASVSAAPRPITLTVPVLNGFDCIQGRVRNNATVNVTLKSSSGNVDGYVRHIQADGQGQWSMCTFRGAIHSGDTITVKVLETGQVRTVTVPPLSARVNRNADTVAGVGPANQTLTLQVFDFQGIVPAYDITQHVATDTAGRYSADLSAMADIVGDAVAVLTWESPQHDLFTLSASAPFVNVGYRTNNFDGETNRGDRVRVSVRNSSGDLLARGNAVGFEAFEGTYSGTFYKTRNREYEVVGGDRVYAPAIGTDTGWSVPSVDGTANPASDVVRGECFPNEPVSVLSFNPAGPEGGFKDVTADGTGHFQADLSSVIDFKRQYVVNITCFSSTGDRVTHEFVVK